MSIDLRDALINLLNDAKEHRMKCRTRIPGLETENRKLKREIRKLKKESQKPKRKKKT